MTGDVDDEAADDEAADGTLGGGAVRALGMGFDGAAFGHLGSRHGVSPCNRCLGDLCMTSVSGSARWKQKCASGEAVTMSLS